MQRGNSNIFRQLLILLVCIHLGMPEAMAQEETAFADQWELVGTAVEEPGYTVWGSSPIIDEDGKVHLFVARWPGELKVDPGWRTHSEIAHYVSDSPEGPFEFSDIAVRREIENQSSPKENSQYAPHNPAIHKVGDKYALFYIVNTGRKKHPSNQYICLSLADSPYGPWKEVGEDGAILYPSENESIWTHGASNGVNNPAFLQHPDGGFFLYFKSQGGKMGLAVAEQLEGPYVQLPYPVTANDRAIEDGYAFIHEGRVALLTTDNHGLIESGGGVLWTSEDGVRFDQNEKGFHRINQYRDIDMSEVAWHYGARREYVKFERPQLLLIDGKAEYLYTTSGSNIYGGDCTVSYVLRRKK